MRNRLDMPKELIDEAMKSTGAKKTKSQLIRNALQAEINRVK